MLRPVGIITTVFSCTTVIMSLLACDGEGGSDDSRTGQKGESCAKSSDCDQELVCIDQVCQASTSGTSNRADAGEGTTSVVTRGQEGESCRARSDCDTDLACIDNVCSLSSDLNTDELTRGEAGESCMSHSDCEVSLVCVNHVCSSSAALSRDASVEQLGTGNRGESCQTRVDCKQGLLCVSGTCQLADYGIDPTDKECVVIECRDVKDCCNSDEIDTTVSPCSTYDINCEANPKPNIYCDYFLLNCTCEGFDCVDEQCERDPPCEDATICGLFSSTRDLCSDDNRCVECTEDDDCGEGEFCKDDQCVGSCNTNLDCDYFHECQDEVCVEVGCQSDRECMALTGNVFSICQNGECQQPCETDLECNGPDNFQFQVCIDGYCGSVGCESDEECRLRMNMLSPSRSDTIDIECR